MNNSSSPLKLPVYLELAQITMGLVALFFILYVGQDIIVPLIFATIFAILLNPIVNFLCNHGFNRIAAIGVAIFAGFILLGGLLFFIGAQFSMFSDSLPMFKKKFTSLSAEAIDWASQTFNLSKPKIQEWIQKAKSEGLKNGSTVITKTLGTMSNLFIMVFLLPVYIFLILFYKPLLLEFIAMLFQKVKQSIVVEVLFETKTLIQSYLIGLLLEAVIVATLNSVGLLIIGVQYGILIGILGAMLNIIPYIGGLIAITIPVIMALAGDNPQSAVWVIALYLVVQFVDNNFIVPKIVASKVKVNALISIIVVLIGGALWGVAGMFLSIPITAILKVIFDRIEALKPFGFLIGDNQPDIGKIIFNFKAIHKKQKKE